MLLAVACGRISKPSGYAEPQIEGDTLYVSINAGKMAALNASDFSLIWEFPEDDTFGCGEREESDHDLRAIYGTPVIDDGRVYLGAYDGNVYAVDAETGDCIWESHKPVVGEQTTDVEAQCNREPDGPIIGGVALVEGLLYVGSDDGQLYGIDVETGAVRACVDMGAAVWSTPLLVEERLYVATMDGAVWAVSTVRAGDPEPAKLFETSAALLTDLVRAGDNLLAGGMDEKLFAIDISTGSKSWEFSGGNWFWGRPVLDGDTVYATDLDGKVYAINADDGSAAWESNSFTAEEAIRAGPLLLDGTLVIADRDGNIYSLNAATGNVTKESLAIIEKRVLANPIEFDGAALVVAQDGSLYRVEPAGEEPPKRVEVTE